MVIYFPFSTLNFMFIIYRFQSEALIFATSLIKYMLFFVLIVSLKCLEGALRQ